MPITQANDIKTALRKASNQTKAAFFPKFFKSGPGQYADGDKFIGVTVPNQRAIARKYAKQTSLNDIKTLLASPWHEERLTALFLLVDKFSSVQDKKEYVDFYLGNLSSVNNWDLVDSSAYQILGAWLTDKTNERKILYELSKSSVIWERRVAIVATMAFIRVGQTQDTFNIAQILMHDEHDLIQKAVGWLLREAGKKDEQSLRKFLDKHCQTMPRTMLRYSIERFDEPTRKRYLGKN